MRPRLRSGNICPCGTGETYGACCQPFHQGAEAPGPEALMRSRYSAYAAHNVRHLMRTTHPEGPHFQPDARQWRRELLAFCKSTQLLGLVVEEVEPGEQVAHVTFVAELRQEGVTAPMRERSLFMRAGERWLYYGVDP